MRNKLLFITTALACFAADTTAQVNLQTGSATFSIPILEWKHDRSRLISNVAITYNSGNGLKVAETTSNIGQGWSLVAGGIITRLQVGEPDDQVAYAGNGSEMDTRKYPAGYINATIPAFEGCPNALTKYPLYKSRNQVYTQHNVLAEDKQLDYFSFQFNGKAGLFVLDTTDGGRGLPLGDTKMKITFVRDPSLTSQGIRTTIKSFTIVDVDGLIYRFTQYGTTKVLESNYCSSTRVARNNQPKFEGGKVYFQAGFDTGPNASPWTNSKMAYPFVIGSWYLKEVEDGLTGEKIEYFYETRNINQTIVSDMSYKENGNYSFISYKTSITQTPDITSISFPDGHNVNFTYGDARVDLTGAKVLSSVNVLYQGRHLSKYQLKTSYFIKNRYGTPVTDYQKSVARLCLRSVTRIGPDLKEDSPPYLFDYYMGSNAADDFVPPPSFYAKDVWGYYNGSNSVDYDGAPVPLDIAANKLNNNQVRGLCFRRNGVSGINLNAKPGYAKNGLLREIIYPTGGTLTYQYEQNTGVIGGSTVNVGGVHVSSTSSTDGGFSNGCANPMTTQYKYILDGPGDVSSLWGVELPVNSMVNGSYYDPEHRKYKWSLSCPFTCCYYQFMYPGILSRNQSISLTEFQQLMEVMAPVLGALTVVTTVMQVATLSASTGVGAIVSLVVSIIGGVVNLIISCSHDYSKDISSAIYYNFDLNSVSSLPTQFKRVEIVENPGTIGKTVQEFTSSDDYAIWFPSNPTFSAKQRYGPWAYGLPKFTRVYDANGNKVREVENTYNFDRARWLLNGYDIHTPPTVAGLFTELVCAKCLVNKSYSQRNTDWADPSKFNLPASYLTSSTADMAVDFYGMYTGRVELSSTKERTYRVTDDTKFVEKTTYYYYNSANYQLSSIITTESNGSQRSRNIQYSSDFSGGVFNTLLQKNIIALPVISQTRIGSATIHESRTSFVQHSTGDIKPYQILERRYDYPGATAPPEVVTQTYTYHSNGTVAGVQDEGGRVIANIYDYNDKYVVAAVINADITVDKPAYTSFETSTYGGWTRTGAEAHSANAVTGTRSFTLSSGKSFSAPLNTAKPYIVSFWSSTSSITVSSGSTLKKSSPTINGFTYYEYEIAQGTSSVTVSGTGNIDELRLYPVTARMSTTTYDPVLGKTSECDENNRVTYYEYDRMGRIQLVRDDHKNVVKFYEYNNVSPNKQNGCPGTYYNRAISEIVRRSNCASGYLGGEVTFSIAADTYSSTLSQEDADAKAEAYLIGNAQAYANANGTCSLIYYNTLQSQTETTENCPEGYKGGSVTYTVPADRYSSIISQADANQQALDEIEANIYAYINDPANVVCVVDNDPDWEWDGETYYCQTPGGTLPAQQVIQVEDMNPNSSTYGQTQWQNLGVQGDCPAGTYFSAVKSQSFTKQCNPGYTGSSVTYTVPAGKYSSTVSQAAADQQATDDVNANGQNYANANGVCNPICSFTVNATGFVSPTNGFSASSGTVTFYMVIYSATGLTIWTGSNLVGTIDGCRPSAQRVFNVTETGRTWQVTINTNGQFYLHLVSGTPPSGMNAFALTGSYQL